METRIDFAKMAEALNVKSEILSHPEDAEKKLKWRFDLISRGKPALIGVQLEKYTKGRSSYAYTFQSLAKKPPLALSARRLILCKAHTKQGKAAISFLSEIAEKFVTELHRKEQT